MFCYLVNLYYNYDGFGVIGVEWEKKLYKFFVFFEVKVWYWIKLGFWFFLIISFVFFILIYFSSCCCMWVLVEGVLIYGFVNYVIKRIRFNIIYYNKWLLLCKLNNNGF